MPVHSRMTIVTVVSAIPELGALPGDEIIISPGDPDFPVVLRRCFPLDVLPLVLTDRVKLAPRLPPLLRLVKADELDRTATG